MVCQNIFGDCKCFAYKDDKHKQFCARRDGLNFIRCSNDCCKGGCTVDGSRQPYRLIDRPKMENDNKQFLLYLWLIITLGTILLFTSLKI